eukprot:698549_1
MVIIAQPTPCFITTAPITNPTMIWTPRNVTTLIDIGTTSDGEHTQGVMNRMKMTKSSSIRKRSASGNTDWNSANLRRRFKNIWIIIEIEMNHNQMYVFVGVYLKTKSKKKLRNTKLRERKSE